jgi:hypothetical protein
MSPGDRSKEGPRNVVGGRQLAKHLLDLRREAVVCGVVGGPARIATNVRKRNGGEYRTKGRLRHEGRVSVPAIGSVLLRFGLVE